MSAPTFPALTRIRSYVRQDAYNDRIVVVVVRDECYGADWTEGPWKQFYLGRDGEWHEYEGYQVIQPALTLSGWLQHVIGLDLKDVLKATVEQQTRNSEAIHEALRALAAEAAQAIDTEPNP